jgi:hypothetical protein
MWISLISLWRTKRVSLTTENSCILLEWGEIYKLCSVFAENIWEQVKTWDFYLSFGDLDSLKFFHEAPCFKK